MNRDFLRLLAGRLERVPWVDTRDSETYTEEAFTGVDGFFMSADVMTAPERCDVLCYEDRIVGSIAAWAAQLIREQGGYHDEDRAWIEAPAELELLHGAPWGWEDRIVGSIGAASIKPECQTPWRMTVAGPLCIRSGCFGLPYPESRGEVG